MFQEYSKIKLPVDFNNADTLGRIRLTCVGTLNRLKELRIHLTEGLPLLLFQEDLRCDGRAVFSEEEKIWVVEIDWDSIEEMPDFLNE
jgi:hypothetical protein